MQYGALAVPWWLKVVAWVDLPKPICSELCLQALLLLLQLQCRGMTALVAAQLLLPPLLLLGLLGCHLNLLAAAWLLASMRPQLAMHLSMNPARVLLCS
jgi:hypothetical protein